MPTEDNKKLKYNHGEKSIKTPFIIYADLECLFEKMSTCHHNPEESSNCLYIVDLMYKLQSISLIVIEVKSAWKGFVRI